MEKENRFIKPEAEIITFVDDVILTSNGDNPDVKDFEDPGTIPFI